MNAHSVKTIVDEPANFEYQWFTQPYFHYNQRRQSNETMPTRVRHLLYERTTIQHKTSTKAKSYMNYSAMSKIQLSHDTNTLKYNGPVKV
jgi:hypothetical protein